MFPAASLDRSSRLKDALAVAPGSARDPVAGVAVALLRHLDIGRLGHHHDQVRIGHVERRTVFGELDLKDISLVSFSHEVAKLRAFFELGTEKHIRECADFVIWSYDWCREGGSNPHEVALGGF